MALTVAKDNFKVVNRQRCLRQSDIKSVMEVAQSMNNVTDEYELLCIARQMLNQNDRNNKAQHNENNVGLFKELLVNRTRHGDILTTASACELLTERGIDYQGARYYALLAALDDLAREGYFTREVVSKRTRRGTSHCTIYIVI